MQKKKIKIGLTGGIGSGKTTVAKLFEILSIPVYYSDLRAKHLIHNNPIIISNIKNSFGENSYDSYGNYNSKYIAGIVFQENEKREQLNQIVHPHVYQDREDWLKKQESPYCIIENAIIYEIGQQGYYDKIIVVQTNDKIRIQRIMKRDGLSKQDVQYRIQSQMPQEKKQKLADFLIFNNGELSVIKQVIEINQRILKMQFNDTKHS